MKLERLPLSYELSPEVIQGMAEAFDRATALMTDQSDEAAESLALLIMAIAAKGECNPEKLAAAALAIFCTGVTAQ